MCVQFNRRLDQVYTLQMRAGLGAKLQAVVYTYMYILDVPHIHIAFEQSEMLCCPVHVWSYHNQ